ncbi:MAG: hypothetical protein A2822_00780, partial [Candidatus Staskawiczbacteria bacterium RIFCSPHIGHO2_01_FULL_41_41]
MLTLKNISKKLRQIFWPKEGNLFSSLITGLVLAGLFSTAFYVFALPYSPGETTDPSCLPTDANCTVTESVPYTGATAAVDLGSKNITTTGTGSFGSLSLTTTSLTVGNGGTGNSSLTAYALLSGGTTTTGALQQISGVGTSGQVLTSNGAGVLPTWQTGSGGGASTALDNLASVAINTSLISDTDDTDDLGSATVEWKDIYIDGTAYIDALDLNGTAMTSTAAQLNYLNAATGTTGTATTNVVFSTSPTLVTPVLGAATGTSLALSAAANLLTLTNSTDGASVQTAILQGDRATITAADEAYATLRLSDAAGTQTEFARLTWVATDVTDLSEDGRIDLAVMTAGTLADEVQLDGTSFAPSASDGNALG